ncbi:MAG: STAS/SEC14 domain-containing protein [Bacteroidia bacterium]|nr:STAS/SEC14 domain-containing protein [Bacteroidia bacterium]
MENVIRTRVFTTWIDNAGICRTKVKQGAIIELADAEENSAAVQKVSAGKIYPMLVDLTHINFIHKSARDHFAMRNRKPGVKVIAMLIGSPVSKVIGNFFLGINKPTVPTQLFTSEKKAVAWLSKFVS